MTSPEPSRLVCNPSLTTSLQQIHNKMIYMETRFYSDTPFRKYKCYITLAVLKRGLSCCAVDFRYDSLDLTFTHLKFDNIFILGMAYTTQLSSSHSICGKNNVMFKRQMNHLITLIPIYFPNLAQIQLYL